MIDNIYSNSQRRSNCWRILHPTAISCGRIAFPEHANHLKVLIINDYAAVIGGAERFIENLLDASQDTEIDFSRLNIAELIKKSKASARSNFVSERYRRIWVISEIEDLIINQIEQIQPDLIHLNNNHLCTNTVIHSLRKKDIPVVWFIHDYYTLRRLQSFFICRQEPILHSLLIHQISTKGSLLWGEKPIS